MQVAARVLSASPLCDQPCILVASSVASYHRCRTDNWSYTLGLALPITVRVAALFDHRSKTAVVTLSRAFDIAHTIPTCNAYQVIVALCHGEQAGCGLPHQKFTDAQQAQLLAQQHN